MSYLNSLGEYLSIGIWGLFVYKTHIKLFGSQDQYNLVCNLSTNMCTKCVPNVVHNEVIFYTIRDTYGEYIRGENVITTRMIVTSYDCINPVGINTPLHMCTIVQMTPMKK